MFENVNTVPKYLYHYTTINSLMEIVTSRKIRFTRLDCLNDPYEGFVSLETNYKSVDMPIDYVYCSCWSPFEEESVAMWEVYTKSAGAMLKFRYDMFLDRKNGFNTVSLEEVGSIVYPLSPIQGLRIERAGSKGINVNRIYGPIKVIYDESISVLNSKVTQKGLSNPKTDYDCDLNALFPLEKGRRKVCHWEYENEFRYLISPFIEVGMTDSVVNLGKIVEKGFPKHIDVSYYRNIEEVVLGSRVSTEDERRIKLFLSEYGINNVKKSEVKMMLR